jgi:hypothetical protein
MAEAVAGLCRVAHARHDPYRPCGALPTRSRSPRRASDRRTRPRAGVLGNRIHTAEYAGHYAATGLPFPIIPLIHTITAPAAMRLLLAELPAELHAAAFRTIAEINRELFAHFDGKRAVGSHASDGPGTDCTFAALAAEAVDVGDEHAIKICEATVHEHAHHPDSRYLGAASAALDLIRRH